MTKPRPRFLNQVIHSVRRTNMRVCRLTPTKEIRDLCGYVIARYAALHSIEVHAVAVMPNHIHIVFTDPEGLRSELLPGLRPHIALGQPQDRGS